MHGWLRPYRPMTLESHCENGNITTLFILVRTPAECHGDTKSVIHVHSRICVYCVRAVAAVSGTPQKILQPLAGSILVTEIRKYETKLHAKCQR